MWPQRWGHFSVGNNFLGRVVYRSISVGFLSALCAPLAPFAFHGVQFASSKLEPVTPASAFPQDPEKPPAAPEAQSQSTPTPAALRPTPPEPAPPSNALR